MLSIRSPELIHLLCASLYPLTTSPQFLHHPIQPLIISILLCFVEFWFFRFHISYMIPHKLYHAVFVFLAYVISLTVVPSMLLQMAGFPSFSLPTSTPLYIYCIYRIFFIHSSLGRHLGCFYVLAIVNNASINIDSKILY